MRQVVLIASGLLVGIGLTLVTDPRLADRHGDVRDFLSALVSGDDPAHSE